MNNQLKKFVSFFLVFTLTLSSLLMTNVSSAQAAVNSTSSAIFRVLKRDVLRPTQSQSKCSSNYNIIGLGKITSGTAYGDVSNKILSYPNLSKVELRDFETLEWYSISREYLVWKVDAQIVTKPEGSVIEADFRILNDGVEQSSVGSFADKSEYTSLGMGKVKLATSNGTDVSDYIVECPDYSNSINEDESIYWYNIGQDNDCWVIEGIIVPAQLPADTLLPENTVNIKDKGAKGDGVTDDSAIINEVLNSGAENVYFPAGTYRCVNRLEINNVSGLNIFGDGKDSIIMTDSEYKGGETANENFFTIWECDNISFKDICIKACEQWTVSYSRQVAAYYVENISFENCSFIVPPTVKAVGPNTDREYSNLTFYTGWKNISVNNCYFEQLGAVERGSNIILTDIWNAGCENAIITNNTFYHNAHDEMFSLFGGKKDSSSMKNITVSNNEFNAMYTDDVSPRTMCFTFAYTDSKNVSNVLFTNNTINATTPGSLMTFGIIDGCEVSNNDINIINNTYYNTGIVFSGTDSVNVKNNNITIDGTDENGMAIVASGNMVFDSNNVVINKSMRYVFTEATVINNTITLNAYAESIAQAPKLMEGNTVTMNDKIDNFISYVQVTLKYESITNNNTFNYNYDDTSDAVSFLTGNAVYVNIGTRLCENTVVFSNNTINAPNVNKFRKNLLAYCVIDETSQTFRFTGNKSDVYADYVYLCQGKVANIITE